MRACARNQINNATHISQLVGMPSGGRDDDDDATAGVRACGKEIVSQLLRNHSVYKCVRTKTRSGLQLVTHSKGMSIIRNRQHRPG